MMKKVAIVGVILYSMIFSTLVQVSAEALTDVARDTPHLAENATSAILMERDTGTILFQKNEHDQLPPASMTKIMTMLLIMEEIDKGNLSLDETVRVSERASSMGGSQIFLEAGEEMTVEDLLKGIAIASGNDASVAIAEKISGSEEAFVQRMNEKAKELNLENTQFKNASGLPAAGHYSTAYDMAIMAKELLKYENITDYTSIYEDYLRKGQKNEFWLVNTNKLVRFYPEVDGLKTGYTSEAKYCLTATALKDDMRVIAVVMGADSIKERNATITSMLDYAFNHYQTHKLYDKGETITVLDHLKSENRHINVVAPESISTISPKGESMDDVTSIIEIDEDIQLPLKKGDQIGTLKIVKDEETILTTPLVVDEDVNTAKYFTLLKRSLKHLVKSY